MFCTLHDANLKYRQINVGKKDIYGNIGNYLWLSLSNGNINDFLFFLYSFLDFLYLACTL